MHSFSSRGRITLLAGLAFCLASSAYAADNTFDRTLSVNGTVTLQVSTGSGYVHVSPGSGNQVHVVGHVHASSGWFGASQADVDKIVSAPPIEQAGNIIRIGPSHGDDLFRHVSIDYDVSTPPDTLLNAFSGSGEIQIFGIKGSVKAQTGSGNIQANSLGSGSKLETGSGTIQADDLGGSAILQTGSGDVRAQFSGEGDVTAGTGSGSIHLADVRGALKVETGSGDLDVSGQPISSWKLETGSGSITLSVGNSRFMLDAETGSGSIQSNLPVASQTSGNKHHLVGSVNGGGPTIKAETGSGSIRIQ